MSGRIFIYSLLFLFSVSCGNNPGARRGKPAKDSTDHKIVALKKGLVDGVEISRIQGDPKIYMMERVNNILIYCSDKGKIEIADTITHKRKLIIDLNAEFMVDKLFIVPRSDNKWFLMWQETDMDGLRSYAALYPANLAKPVWKMVFSDPNPGKPVVDGDDAYISTLGMAAKISLTDGKIIWQKDSLYNQYKFSFQKMDKALVYPDKVVFVDLPIPGQRENRDSLIVDPDTGKRKK